MRSYFPDVNVWIALTYRAHLHHPVAGRWLEGIGSHQICFCRLTQLGFLRLLTNRNVMGDQVRSQRQAWQVYDLWLTDERVAFRAEPSLVDPEFRRLTQSSHAASAAWPDAYLAAIAATEAATVVTLDNGFRSFAGADVLLLA